MIASKVLILVACAISIHASAVDTQVPINISKAVNADLVSVTPLSNVGAVEFLGTTRLIYQDSNGAIVQYGIWGGSFVDGRTQFNASVLVPATEPQLRGTPIVCTAVSDGSGFYVYYLSPNRILKEYKWTAAGGGKYGDACSECVDKEGFAVQSNWLYGLQNPTTGVLRVGFISPATPGTLSEAVKMNDAARWQFAPLPN